MNHISESNHQIYTDILYTAKTCFLQKGFEATTISDICHALKITHLQFLMYFESLDDVLESLWSGELKNTH